ncbi:MAG: cytidine deaminase [Clostridiaceae bacterium]|nr:cytidine deaminase [Clostridiaceae bacterium]
MDDKTLFSRALAARELAYAPYSHFTVGAALLCTDGTVYTGCNIENAAFSPTVCAERVAFSKAVSEGRREFAAIAIAGAPEGAAPDSPCAPCGVCRQVMAEFCRADMFRILLGTAPENLRVYTLAQLLPLAFSGDSM